MNLENTSRRSQERLHLLFLDGLRGVAALYVVLFHVIADGRSELTADGAGLNFLRFGHEAVVVFIVLSGFVLTLPVCRSPGMRLPDGLAGFVSRRARRILPAYYASLLMLPLFFLVIELLKHLTGAGTDWTRLRDRYVSTDMLSHLFLLHNLSREWVNSINPVLWSLSTEWWIYFVFALLLLPTWRRFGLVTAVLLCIVLSLVPASLLFLGLPTLLGSPHLLAGFGLGMASAGLLLADGNLVRINRNRGLLTVAMILIFLLFSVIAVAAPSIRLSETTGWMTDLLLAVVCALLILLTASAAVNEPRMTGLATAVPRLLEWAPLVRLGGFSYSLYLTHLVVLAMMGITLNLEPVQRYVDLSLDSMPARIFVVIPVLLAFAYGFYLLFERPFLQSRPKRAVVRQMTA